MNKSHLPLPVNPAPDPVDPELEPLLGEHFAEAWASGAQAPQAQASALRGRLLARLAVSRAEANLKFTARRRRLQSIALAPGVQACTLYTAADHAQRPGEPALVRLIELEPGSHWAGPAPDRHREYLVLQGAVQLGDEHLQLRDYHVAPTASPAHGLRSDGGAMLFLRESAVPAGAAPAPFTVHDDAAGWPDYAPGIQRRVLWAHAGQAAMLYYAQPGASVPLHTHGHDEECLMVQGELFLDDVLLQPGDYQLAPAGTGHRITATDTGVVIYAHGDLDLQFVT
jgi:quercetin dioxygenase-like cupin family protein